MNQYQVTAVCLSRDDQHVMSGGIDNDIKVFDVRKLDLAYTMQGHTDTVTGAWWLEWGASGVWGVENNTRYIAITMDYPCPYYRGLQRRDSF